MHSGGRDSGVWTANHDHPSAGNLVASLEAPLHRGDATRGLTRIDRPFGAVDFESYLPARRCQRVAFSIFLCFFFRMRLRRFLISDPMCARHGSCKNGRRAHSGVVQWQDNGLWSRESAFDPLPPSHW